MSANRMCACLPAFGAVDTVRDTRNGTSGEIRHFIISEAMAVVPGSSGALADNLRRVLDVRMNEDGQRNRTGNGIRSIVAAAGKSGDNAPDGVEPVTGYSVREEQADAPDAEDGRVGRPLPCSAAKLGPEAEMPPVHKL